MRRMRKRRSHHSTTHRPLAGFDAVAQAGKELTYGVHDHRGIREASALGLFTALAIAIHNFPEGLATFSAALRPAWE